MEVKFCEYRWIFATTTKFDAEFWEKNTLAGMDTEKNNLRQYFHNIK